jgi:hypothetical protein
MSDLTESKVDQEESKEQIVIVTRLETNDVVMGRGAQAVSHTGNISFRDIVSGRRQEVCVLVCMCMCACVSFRRCAMGMHWLGGKLGDMIHFRDL